MNLDERIEVEREKLHKLIEENADKKEILRQSQVLDELITKTLMQ